MLEKLKNTPPRIKNICFLFTALTFALTSLSLPFSDFTWLFPAQFILVLVVLIEGKVRPRTSGLIVLTLPVVSMLLTVVTTFVTNLIPIVGSSMAPYSSAGLTLLLGLVVGSFRTVEEVVE